LLIDATYVWRLFSIHLIVMRNLNDSMSSNQRLSALNSLIPVSSHYPLMRIGGFSDGAYLLPDDLKGIRSCFSPGVNTTKTFEDELVRRYKMSCFLCDYSTDITKLRTPLISGSQFFDKKWLDIDSSLDSWSLEEWISLYSPEDENDLLLQMDIEGAEYRNILAAPSEILNRFRIIVIEYHDLISAFCSPESNPLILSALLKLHTTHGCVHVHPNNNCKVGFNEETGRNVPDLLEVTYLRRDRLVRGHSPLFHPLLPHPLDIPINIPREPILYLNSNWHPFKKRSIASKGKILFDVFFIFSLRAIIPLGVNIKKVLRYLKRF